MLGLFSSHLHYQTHTVRGPYADLILSFGSGQVQRKRKRSTSVVCLCVYVQFGLLQDNSKATHICAIFIMLTQYALQFYLVVAAFIEMKGMQIESGFLQSLLE